MISVGFLTCFSHCILRKVLLCTKALVFKIIRLHHSIGLLANQQLRSALVVLTGTWILSACSHTSQLPVAIDQQYKSENHNARIRLVVLHYTTSNWQSSLDVLTQPGPNAVSAHYLIPESGDASYPKERPLRVYQLVPESQRAWHAGHSRWQQLQSVNDQSIGIELVNQSRCSALNQTATIQPIISSQPVSQGQTSTREQTVDRVQIPPSQHFAPPTFCLEQDFDPTQIQLLVGLLKQILQRHPDMSPTAIVAHSDVAPGRKQDPGSRFPWRELARHGIGAWYDDTVYQRYLSEFSTAGVPDLLQIQQALAFYGYGIDVSGLRGLRDQQTEQVVLAFQRHFVQHQVIGMPQPQIDIQTAAALFALLEKYYPRQLANLRPTQQ